MPIRILIGVVLAACWFSLPLVGKKETKPAPIVIDLTHIEKEGELSKSVLPQLEQQLVD